MRGFNGDSELGCFLFESFVNMKAGLKCVPTSSRLFESAFIKTGEHLFNSLAEQYLTGQPCTRAMPPPPPTPAQVTTRRNVIFAFWVRSSCYSSLTCINRLSFFLDFLYGGKRPTYIGRNCLLNSWIDGRMERYGNCIPHSEYRRVTLSSPFPLQCGQSIQHWIWMA